MNIRKLLSIVIFIVTGLISSFGQTDGIFYGLSSNSQVPNALGYMYFYDPIDSLFSPFYKLTYGDGNTPVANFFQASDGTLYCTTYTGGASGAGSIMSVNIATNSHSLLYSFDGSSSGLPNGNLVQDTSGYLYCLTHRGGTANGGVIFRYDPVKNIGSVLYNLDNSSGYSPNGSLLLYNGTLYGMTSTGGPSGDGTIFGFNLSTNVETNYVNLSSVNGLSPSGGFILASDSLLYAMASAGGVNGGYGVLLSFNPVTQQESVLLSFSDTNGSTPYGTVMQAYDKNLYGLTSAGGKYGNGVLFRYNITTGQYVVLFNFHDSTTGASPYGSLIQANDSLLYGTTYQGGLYNSGVLFSFNLKTNQERVLEDFNKATNFYQTYGDPLEVMTAKLVTRNNYCYGDSQGTAAILVRGGHYPLKYLWSNGATTDTVEGLKAGNYTGKVIDQKGIAYSVNFTITQPPQLKDSLLQITNELCYGNNNGEANLAMQGGVKPYTYLWSSSLGTQPVVHNVSAGSYTCTVTDSNGCITQVPVIVSQPPLLKDSTVLVQDLTCSNNHNGRIVTQAIGGTAPYTFSWSSIGGVTDSLSGIAAGTYTCTVNDSDNCVATNIVTVTSPLPINPSPTYTVTPCAKNQGAAMVNVSGGAAPYTYAWSPGGNTNASDTGLSAGTYTCTITDSAGCIYSSVIIVPNNNGPKDSIYQTTNVLCNGDSTGSAIVTVSGGKLPYKYSWSPYGGNDTVANDLSAGGYTFTATDSMGCIGLVSLTIAQPAPFRDSIVQATNVNCFGGNDGSVEAGIIGGTAPYTFTWSSGVAIKAYDSLLTAGVYTCTVQDKNNCPAPAIIVNITSPVAINVDTLAKATQCGKYNGSAVMIVSGGVAPYQYLWSPGGQITDTISGVKGGTYRCTISDSHNCIVNTQVVVPDTGGPKAMISSQTNEACYGGNTGVAIVNAYAGSPPYTYSWSNGSTNAFAVSLPAGPVVCKIADTSGCSYNVTVNITQPSQIQGNIQTIGTCYGVLSGGSATITVSGGTPPYSLSWSTGSTNDSIADVTPGSYFCTITDSAKCQVIDTAHIRQAAPLTILSMVVQTTSCFGCNNGSVQVNVTGGIPPGDSSYYFYIWSNGIIGSPVISNLDSGIYSVCVTSPYGCGTICDSTDVVTGIGTISYSQEMKIYPIPSTGVVNIDFSAIGEEEILTISNELGEAVYNANYSQHQNHLSLNLSNLPDGLYFVRIVNGNNLFQGKIIIQK